MSEKLLSRMAVAIYVNNIGLDHYVPRETVTETFEDAIIREEQSCDLTCSNNFI